MINLLKMLDTTVVCFILPNSLMEIVMGPVQDVTSDNTIYNMDTYTLNNSKLYSLYIYDTSGNTDYTDYTGDDETTASVCDDNIDVDIDVDFQIGWNYIVNPYEEEYKINYLLEKLDPYKYYTIGVEDNDIASAIMIRTPNLTANGNGDDEHWLNFAEIDALVVSPYEGYYISFSDISPNPPG
jgi:hypothetical protein